MLYSGGSKCEYRYSDVFPNFSKDGELVIFDKALNSSIAIMEAEGSNRQRIFNADSGAAFMPTWSPDDQWIAFGYGG